MKSITLTQKDVERFWRKVKIGNPDDCWEWQAHTNNKGYGVFGIKSDIYLAHRVSYLIKTGDVSDVKIICHTCDNPSCVNPIHLFCGTMMDNMTDKMAKGRYVKGFVYKGESHKLSKLSETDIPIIRKMYDAGVSTHKIAERFGVTSKTIWSVGKRISWNHVKQE